MADDFIRITYRRVVDGQLKRSSVSIDPLMFEIFCKIRGSISGARETLREWAKAADVHRTEANWSMGNSRIVQQQMSQEILELVNEGMSFRAQRKTKKGKGLAVDGAAQAGIESGISQQLPAVTGHLEVADE